MAAFTASNTFNNSVRDVVDHLISTTTTLGYLEALGAALGEALEGLADLGKGLVKADTTEGHGLTPGTMRARGFYVKYVLKLYSKGKGHRRLKSVPSNANVSFDVCVYAFC